jgi:hypothetical protein
MNCCRSNSEDSHQTKPASVDDLDPEQHELLRKKTVLDRKLYDAVLERFGEESIWLQNASLLCDTKARAKVDSTRSAMLIQSIQVDEM